MKRLRQSAQSGFSMLELAISLAVLGLIALGFTAYWQHASQTRVAQAEHDLLTQSRAALLGFVHANYRLPCPAADAQGVEVCGAKASAIGQLPWRTLGLPHAATGQVRYGVYRAPNTVSPWLDQDLTVAMDRLVPLNNITANAPAPVSPPIPPTVAPTPNMNFLIGNSNLLDFCYATGRAAANLTLNKAALSVADSGAGATLRPVAFALALPGLLDADGDGDPFDGRQHTATASAPVFDAANRPQSAANDDKVLAVGFDELFGALGCGSSLSAIDHGHVNTATAAAIMAQSTVDYKQQLVILDLQAAAGIAQATGSVASASAGLILAGATLANSIAATLLTYGTGSALIAPATAAVVSNTVAVAAAVAGLGEAIALKVVTAQQIVDFQPLVDASASRAISIDANWRTADALGF